MRLSRNRGAAETIHLTDQNFDETLTATPGLVMVDFWAEWCGPCRAIAPVLEELAEASEGQVTLMNVNVDENHGLAIRYAIRSIPTIVFFKDGAVVDRGRRRGVHNRAARHRQRASLRRHTVVHRAGLGGAGLTAVVRPIRCRTRLP